MPNLILSFLELRQHTEHNILKENNMALVESHFSMVFCTGKPQPPREDCGVSGWSVRQPAEDGGAVWDPTADQMLWYIPQLWAQAGLHCCPETHQHHSVLLDRKRLRSPSTWNCSGSHPHWERLVSIGQVMIARRCRCATKDTGYKNRFSKIVRIFFFFLNFCLNLGWTSIWWHITFARAVAFLHDTSLCTTQQTSLQTICKGIFAHPLILICRVIILFIYFT